MNTIRESIIQEIHGNLGEIRVSGGYNSDAGQLVMRSEAIGNIDLLPAVSFAPGIENAQNQRYRQDTLVMPVTITAMSRYAENNESQAEIISQLGEMLLGDIRMAMALPVSLSSDVAYASGGIEDYPEFRQGEIAVQVKADYVITYHTIKNNPYEQ